MPDFDSQLHNLSSAGYEIPSDEVLKPLHDKASGNFILVIPADAEQAVAHTTLAGKPNPAAWTATTDPASRKTSSPSSRSPTLNYSEAAVTSADLP